MANQYASWARRRRRADRKRAGDGEGSRGGKVIGHTKTGKPVYGPHDELHKSFKDESEKRYNAKVHETVGKTGFNKDEHKDAAEHHLQAHEKNKGSAFGDMHLDLARAHLRAAAG